MSPPPMSSVCSRYPDATPADLLASDNVCIICREEMVTGAKKLPCNHIFHSRSGSVFTTASWTAGRIAFLQLLQLLQLGTGSLVVYYL